ncbi:hypothetical protein, partial [Marinomonas sp. BSi20414]|uniref:hypothetical protein n=1 Tax=Marinomonas sp. BSi20414 TaxID=388374 RepID=UPI0021C14A47
MQTNIIQNQHQAAYDFVGHHKRSVMCRFVHLKPSRFFTDKRLVRQITPRASANQTYVFGSCGLLNRWRQFGFFVSVTKSAS